MTIEERVNTYNKNMEAKLKPIKEADILKVLKKDIKEFVIKTKDGTELRNSTLKGALRDLATISGYKII